MDNTQQSGEQGLRLAFESWNRLMLLMWRLGLGVWMNAWPDVAGRVMVVTHHGRRTGLRRRTPVNYAAVDGEIYCTAGVGGVSDWHRALRNHPEVQVWLPDGWYAGIAEEVTDARMRLPLLRQVLISSGLLARAAGIDPHVMTNEELDATTRGHRLIHIHRTRACTGSGGPGDLSWVWPLATFGLLLMLLFRPRRD